MIGHSGVRADRSEVRDESPERLTIRKQDREVVKTQTAARRHGRSALAMMQHDKRRRVVACAQGDVVSLGRDGAKSDHLLVVRDRARELGHLQMHCSKRRLACSRCPAGALVYANSR